MTSIHNIIKLMGSSPDHTLRMYIFSIYEDGYIIYFNNALIIYHYELCDRYTSLMYNNDIICSL